MWEGEGLKGCSKDIDQSVGQGQPTAPMGPISLHTYEGCYNTYHTNGCVFKLA